MTETFSQNVTVSDNHNVMLTSSDASEFDLIHWLFRAFTYLELILSIGSYAVIILCFYVFVKVQLFHKHLIFFIKCIFMYYLVAATLRVIVIIQEILRSDQGMFTL